MQPAVRLFAGDIRFWEHGANGARVPVIPEPTDTFGNQPIETNSLVFGYEAGDEISVVSKRRDARYNQPIHSETQPGTTNVTATLLEVPPLILARMLFGEGTSGVVSAGAATDAAHTIASAGVPYQLPHRMLLASPAPTVEKGEDTLVAGTDYRIDLRRGLLMPIAGGDIEDGDELVLNYSYAAHVSTKIEGGAVPTKSFYIDGDMQDRISGENGELRIPQANLTVDGDVDWLSAEPIQVTLTGPVIVAAGESAPYTFEAYKASA
jgi:hypothetical protein